MDLSLNGNWWMIIDPDNIGIKEEYFSLKWILNQKLDKNVSKIKKNKEKKKEKDDTKNKKQNFTNNKYNINKNNASIIIDKDTLLQTELPKPLNLLPNLAHYQGIVWYFKELPNMPYRPKTLDYYLELEGANYKCDAWINGTYIGHHEGGFLPFRFQFDPRIILLNAVNYVAIRIDTKMDRSGIPSNNYDWFNWTGIYRNIQIVILETSRIREIKILPKIIENGNKAKIKVQYRIKNPQDYLDRCYIEGIEPKIEYELFFLGQFFAGERQIDKVLIQTGTQTLDPKDLDPIQDIPHDPNALKDFFKDVVEDTLRYQEQYDLNLYFENIRIKEKKSIDKKKKEENEDIIEKYKKKNDEHQKKKEFEKEKKKKKIRLTKLKKIEKERAQLNSQSYAPEQSTTYLNEQLPAYSPADYVQYEKKLIQKTNKLIDEDIIYYSDLPDEFALEVKNPSIWSPQTPDLYELHLKLNGVDQDKYIRFGIREIYVKKHHLYLNHKPIRLYGVSLHEELLPYGRTIPNNLRRKDLINIKRLGFNALRTAHYPHDHSLISMADEEGLLIFEEIPVYWDIDFKNEKTINLAKNMIRNLIKRDFNNPSVIVWSVGNEIPIERYECQKFIRTLLKTAEKIDPTRISIYVSNRMFGDSLRKEAKITCINSYCGWYWGSVYQLPFILNVAHSINPKIPLIVTEFGAGAKQGIHGEDIKFSEENQARIISYQIEIMNSAPFVAGWFIWIYRDFLSPLRTNPYQNGFNRKGIVDENNIPKMIAKVMPKIIKRKSNNFRYSRFLIPLFSRISKIVEKTIWMLISPVYKMQRNLIKKTYKKKTSIDQYYNTSKNDNNS